MKVVRPGMSASLTVAATCLESIMAEKTKNLEKAEKVLAEAVRAEGSP